MSCDLEVIQFPTQGMSAAKLKAKHGNRQQTAKTNLCMKYAKGDFQLQTHTHTGVYRYMLKLWPFVFVCVCCVWAFCFALLCIGTYLPERNCSRTLTFSPFCTLCFARQQQQQESVLRAALTTLLSPSHSRLCVLSLPFGPVVVAADLLFVLVLYSFLIFCCFYVFFFLFLQVSFIKYVFFGNFLCKLIEQKFK